MFLLVSVDGAFFIQNLKQRHLDCVFRSKAVFLQYYYETVGIFCNTAKIRINLIDYSGNWTHGTPHRQGHVLESPLNWPLQTMNWVDNGTD